jgi:vacuolar protein sorting-associated protein 41
MNIMMSNVKYVDIVASFQTSYHISGVAPYGDALVVLAYIPDFGITVPSRQVK